MIRNKKAEDRRSVTSLPVSKDGSVEHETCFRRRAASCVIGFSLLVWCVNAVWLALDSRPPAWDMAMHQNFALNYIAEYNLDPGQVPLWSYSGVYPPFVHLVIAALFILFHPGTHVAVLCNVPATILLFWGLYQLTSYMAGHRAARWACFLTAVIPYLIWMSRETILDYWLSAWLAAGLACLVRTCGFQKRGACVLLGVVCAFGMLTKWLFAGLFLFPVVYTVIRSRAWRDSLCLKNLGIAALITTSFAGSWYAPNCFNLARFFSHNAEIGAAEGEPPVLSFQSWIYYLRLLEGYQVFGILFVLLVVSWFLVWKRGMLRDSGLLVSTIVGGWVVLTLIRTKDPRFSMPLLGPLTIAAGVWLQSWASVGSLRAIKIALAMLLVFQVYAANFGVSWLPEEAVLAKGYQGSLRWNWNLYLQHYFHIMGPPRLEDWRQAEILKKIDQDAPANGRRRSMALIPDLPRFSTTNFSLYARLMRIPVKVYHLVSTPRGIYPLDSVDYVVASEGEQGMPWTTASSRDLNELVARSSMFELIAQYPLPEGSYARLYRIGHHER